ncbi:hypothetical protein MAY82_14605 [Edwardsiella ictaluri]|nr:hypothetical protein [Edwardsiella ictaluri]WFO12322.1 hypothetical protein MAY82_14605 [Edwardsiella ictaluri]
MPTMAALFFLRVMFFVSAGKKHIVPWCAAGDRYHKIVFSSYLSSRWLFYVERQQKDFLIGLMREGAVSLCG